MINDAFCIVSGRVQKDRVAGSVLDYAPSWARWLAPVLDTIVSATVEGTDVTVDSFLASQTGVTFWLSGGTPGVIGSVKITITTAGGRVDVRTLYFRTLAG
jgi:hypothetical protein